MMPFPLFLALKYLKPERSFVSVVTIISIIGVNIGVAILIIVLSVMTGFDNMWREKILSFKPHLTVTSITGIIEDDEALSKAIETVDGVTGVSPCIETRVMIQHEGRMVPPILVGISPDRASSVSRITNCIQLGKFDLQGNNMIIGIDMAANLGLIPGRKALVYSPLNAMSRDEIYLPEELKVAGVFNMGMRDYDSAFIITSIDVARELLGIEKGSQAVYVMTSDPLRFEQTAADIRQAVGPGYQVRTWKEVDRLMFDALAYEKSMMMIILIFITIVALFCVTVTLIVITVQKTNEIGLLKSLGFSSARIMAVFLWHGWIQCLTGTLLGIGTALLVLNNMQRIIKFLTFINIRVFPKEIYGLSEIPWDKSGQDILPVAAMVMIFCTLFSLLPAWRAARMKPVEALRYE